MSLLAVRGLTVALPTGEGEARALDGVDLELAAGGTLGIVGESGSGKSMTALALMGLAPAGARIAGKIALDGEDLLALGEREMDRIRGARLAMIFQEPMTSLNPVHRVGQQIGEVLALHRDLAGGAAREEARRLLERVELPRPARLLRAYPHELSGGQRQRVMIAMALAGAPDLLIADEPTTALDVTVQERILTLINDLVDAEGMGLIMISHDFGVIARTCEAVAIMYGGRVVERGPVADVLARPAHPYARGLIEAVPRLGRGRAGRLATIAGAMPALGAFPAGCPFADRCPQAEEACQLQVPAMRPLGPARAAACHLLEAAP